MKYDFAIIGSGIIGLTLAFKLKQKFINSNIIIFEKETILFLMVLEEIAASCTVVFTTNQAL